MYHLDAAFKLTADVCAGTYLLPVDVLHEPSDSWLQIQIQNPNSPSLLGFSCVYHIRRSIAEIAMQSDE